MSLPRPDPAKPKCVAAAVVNPLLKLPAMLSPTKSTSAREFFAAATHCLISRCRIVGSAPLGAPTLVASTAAIRPGAIRFAPKLKTAVDRLRPQEHIAVPFPEPGGVQS